MYCTSTCQYYRSINFYHIIYHFQFICSERTKIICHDKTRSLQIYNSNTILFLQFVRWNNVEFSPANLIVRHSSLCWSFDSHHYVIIGQPYRSSCLIFIPLTYIKHPQTFKKMHISGPNTRIKWICSKSARQYFCLLYCWWFVVFLSVDSDGVNVLARHLIFDFWHMKNCISTPFGIIGGICGSVHCSQILFESDWCQNGQCGLLLIWLQFRWQM